MGRLVQRINELEGQFTDQTDLVAHTGSLRERLDSGETLDALLPEAFAAVREAAKRTKNMRHFDVQLMGGITLHEGCIAEMRTGEGKTLMATLPAYLNALPGKSVHVVTVNDYLATAGTSGRRSSPNAQVVGVAAATGSVRRRRSLPG